MHTVKVSELTGEALDYAVALAEGATDTASFPAGWRPLRYSTDWSQGGPIIDQVITKLFKNVGGTYTAQIRHEESHPLVSHKVLAGWTYGSGPTMLIAALRCYVASKLGEEVEIPDELAS